MKSCRQNKFEGGMLLRKMPTTLFQIFCKIILNFKIVTKKTLQDDDIFQKNPLSINGLRTNQKCEQVAPKCLIITCDEVENYLQFGYVELE